MAGRGNARGLRVAAENASPISADIESDDWPVIPLGKFGTMHFYLDDRRQMIELGAKDHSRLGIQGLFGQHFAFLYKAAPRCNKEGEVTGWKPEIIAQELMAECSRAGIWDPEKRERGRGAWRDEDGALLLHTGGTVLRFPVCDNPYAQHERLVPGKIGRFVYPAGEDIPGPSHARAAGGAGGPGEQLLALLRTWNWRRAEIDPVLLLGWFGAAIIGGALKWRPAAWLTGGKGTGKSTLQELISNIFEDALVDVANTTGAAIWQALRRDTLPVGVDELEAAEDNRRAQQVIELARVAASGGRLRRGGSDHHGVEFTVRSAFLFSSVLIPPLLPQDRSRLAILELLDLVQGAAVPDVSLKVIRPLADLLRRRMVDGWARLESTLAFYRASLQAQGHSARGCDQFGTMLACADVLLFDGDPESETASGWVAQLVPGEMAELDDDGRDEEKCLAHLLSASIDPFRNGTQKMMAEWVRAAAGWSNTDDQLAAQQVLQRHGMRLEMGKAPTLAFANYHQGLADLFKGTHWAGRSGSQGVYIQALRRLPGARRGDKPLYFAGPMQRAVVVPLESVMRREDAKGEAGALL